ncbi:MULTISPECIES: sigma-70 family RNA polymerase sigma factor [Sphingomonadaceae]|jgi:RNA polymerase sigma factor (sigma-70 family)|uniref:sigma-70 family RNA polymerase sigma factor n=1 Tax=Sphingomonadales TaxID=204457 RepID=UPI0000D7AD44|nr:MULTISPECIES: sigma-70 family RNA polymerase sigma factor [Sphingomonadaceae]EAT09478.1 putative RNA polymerase sigma factor protein, ECF family protein [Sphingomonas sp. SKA58]MAP44320.1 RNA polymerase subunit sigma-70 [Sphingobium sp.]MBA38428.1 RNA polymerase subunit sigma-70 [Sphingobium sp.]MBS48467.1 RNA polymerase subunit sigma-70 [Sphingobium sp.]MCC4256733.1 sigma-70 family RNA polymerase sigma factor [Sphingobium lactosutens]|tara:strand:- start:45 stop:584 length:540 start_codon:yes stop_codon:yes gene_type:complete
MQTGEEVLRGLMIDGLGGDAAAHASLLRQIVPLLRGFYRRRVRGADDDVEDLVQETLIAVHTRRGTYDRDRPFTAWMFSIARYKMIDHFRRAGRLRPIGDLEETLVVEDFEAGLIARLDIDDLLAGLPPKQARMIVATHIDGLTTAEAAAAGGIGQSDVKVSVHRGLKALIAKVQRTER